MIKKYKKNKILTKNSKPRFEQLIYRNKLVLYHRFQTLNIKIRVKNSPTFTLQSKYYNLVVIIQNFDSNVQSSIKKNYK